MRQRCQRGNVSMCGQHLRCFLSGCCTTSSMLHEKYSSLLLQVMYGRRSYLCSTKLRPPSRFSNYLSIRPVNHN
ncbi:hypothetical protein SK128_003154 [Halocaridina rubra]|uniref:Uncharacterized protein n=1 Tax=Halocaridina rubra TaxID=373956 RepID=A0AAN8WXV4_HALRR